MKPRSKYELSKMLSMYVDGELNEAQTRELEGYIASNPEIAKELQELRAMKDMLAMKERVPETLGFWTRLSARLDSREKEKENLLPFPRKYLPLVYTASAIAVVLLAVFLIRERSNVIDYVSRQSDVVQRTVEDKVLKGTLLPLFTSVDKNQALQFAVSGVLPLDAKKETLLRVDENLDQGYRIDVGKKAMQAIPAVTVTEFVDEIQATQRQREMIDSILDMGRRQIESSVLLAEDRGMAIDANFPRLNRVMLSSIAEGLEPPQRVRFERFLKARRAPYMIASTRQPMLPTGIIVQEVSHRRKSNRMIVVTPDTLIVSQVGIDLDSLRRHFKTVAAVRPDINVNFDGFVRRIAEREATFKKRFMVEAQPFLVTGDSEALTIRIDHTFRELPTFQHDEWIQLRVPVSVEGSRRSRGRSFNFNFNFDGRDSSFLFNLDMDSLFLRMQKEGPEAAFEFFMRDPNLQIRSSQWQVGRSRAEIDSMMKAKKRARARLDSLLRIMQERELRRQK